MYIKIVVLFLGSLSLNAMGADKEQGQQKKEAAKTEAAIAMTKKVASVTPVQTQQTKNQAIKMLKFAWDDDFEDELLEFFLASRQDLVFEPSVQENPNDVLEAFSGVGNKKN